MYSSPMPASSVVERFERRECALLARCFGPFRLRSCLAAFFRLDSTLASATTSHEGNSALCRDEFVLHSPRCTTYLASHVALSPPLLLARSRSGAASLSLPPLRRRAIVALGVVRRDARVAGRVRERVRVEMVLGVRKE